MLRIEAFWTRKLMENCVIPCCYRMFRSTPEMSTPHSRMRPVALGREEPVAHRQSTGGIQGCSDSFGRGELSTAGSLRMRLFCSVLPGLADLPIRRLRCLTPRRWLHSIRRLKGTHERLVIQCPFALSLRLMAPTSHLIGIENQKRREERRCVTRITDTVVSPLLDLPCLDQ